MIIFFFKQKTAYEMRISDWSSDVCSSDLPWGSPSAGEPRVVIGLEGDPAVPERFGPLPAGAVDEPVEVRVPAGAVHQHAVAAAEVALADREQPLVAARFEVDGHGAAAVPRSDTAPAGYGCVMTGDTR